jgi:Major Facilitator Superfamily
MTDPAGDAGTAGVRRGDVLLRSAFVVSSTGDWIYRFALPLLVLRQTGSALSTAFTYVLEIVPYVLIGLFAGTVADRADRRRLMIGCDSAAALMVGAMGAVLLTGHPPLWLLYSLALLLATARPVYFPAFQGFLVDRVAGARRVVVNAWVQGTDSTLSMLGPVIGVAVVTFVGPGVACVANAVSFVLSAGLIWLTASTVRPHQPARWGEMARHVSRDFRLGVRYILDSSALRWGTVLMTLTNFASMGLEANLIYIVTAGGHASSGSIAIVFAVLGAGALAGATIAPLLIRRLPVGTILAAAMGLMAVALTLPVFAPATPLIGLAMFLVGVSTSAIVVPWFTFRQSIVPSELIGRVTSVGRSLSYITIPLGAVFGSWVISTVGSASLFVFVGALQGVAWLGTLLSPLRRAGRRDPALVEDEAAALAVSSVDG